MAQKIEIKKDEYEAEVQSHIEDREQRKLSTINLRMGRLGKAPGKLVKKEVVCSHPVNNEEPAVAEVGNRIYCRPESAINMERTFSSKINKYSMVMGKQDPEEYMLNEAASNLFVAFLQMMELMFFEIDSIYVHEVVDELKEQNLYKFEFKKLANEMVSVQERARIYSVSSDYRMLENFCGPIFPYFIKEYRDDGCSMISFLQMMFYSEFRDEIRKIEACTKLALNMVRNSPINSLVAKLEGLMLLGNTYMDLEKVLLDRIKHMLPFSNYGAGALKGYNEKFMSQAMKMLKMLKMDQLNFPEREGNSIRSMAAEFQQKLIDPAMLDKVQEAIKNSIQDFTEWTIAKLKLVMNENNGKLPFGYYRVLLARLGSYDNVVLLLKAIYKLRNPSKDVECTLDYKLELPKIKKGTYLSHFRELCMEDKYLMPHGGKDVPMRVRKLRTIADRSGGVLPMTELKKMYKKLGTKKAMIETLKKGGKALEPTLELLNRTKVVQLRAA